MQASVETLRQQLDGLQQQSGLARVAGAGVSRTRDTADPALHKKLAALAYEIEHRRLHLQALDRQIHLAERQEGHRELALLEQADEELQAELASVRTYILNSLRALAPSLRRYQELADKKNKVASQLAALTQTDRSYATYLDTALLRKEEFTGDIRYVIELLKKLRVAV